MELCEKYNLEPEGTFFDVREYGSNPATLYANGKEIDSNFHYKMITVTDDVYILSENNKIELQLIDSSVEGLLNQINDAEGCFNCGAQQGKIRVVIVV